MVDGASFFLSLNKPTMKTEKANSIGSGVVPERIATLWAPIPRAAVTLVANILFNPFPSVAPEKKLNNNEVCEFLSRHIVIVSELSKLLTNRELEHDHDR